MENPARQVNDPQNAHQLVKGGFYEIEISGNRIYIGSASCEESRLDNQWASAEHDAIAYRVVEELYGDCYRNIRNKATGKTVKVLMKQAMTLKHFIEAGCSVNWVNTYYHRNNGKGLTLAQLYSDEDLLVAHTKISNRDKEVFGGNFVYKYYPNGIPEEVAKEIVGSHKESILERIVKAEDMSYRDFTNIASNTEFVKSPEYELPSISNTLEMLFKSDPYDLYQQSNMYRYNCEETIKKESDAEHHAYTTQITLKIIELLEENGVQLDNETKYLAMAGAVTHDVGELKFGDMSITLKQEYPELSEISNKVEHEEICKFYGFCRPYSAAQENAMARAIYKLADHIDLLLFCQREIMLGNQNPNIKEIYERSSGIVNEAYENLKEVLGCREQSSS